MNAKAITRIATDVGGTFTDLVYIKTLADGCQEMGTAKSDTTPPNFEQGVMDVFENTGLEPDSIDYFAHGTTVIINALTEKKGAKTALITTEGFRDVLEIARGNRPDFFNLDYEKPSPFVERYLRHEVAGRMSYRGEELEPLDLAGLDNILSLFKSEDVEAIAVCLINSYTNPAHEIAIVTAIEERWPEVTCTPSYKIIREWREYERTNTTVLSSYVKPIAVNYLNKLEQKLNGCGVPNKPYIMQSNCGVDTIHNAKEIPITMVESGPASGVWGAAALGKIIGEEQVIALDIGGTTAKCSLISDGNVRINTDYMIEQSKVSAGYPIKVPVVDLVEIGNGGGSIAWVDRYEKMHVGPQSAGALPGPAAYGKGGVEPTTTDANLVLGRINQNYFCGGAIKADMHAANKAMDHLGSKMQLSRQEAARGIIRIANNNMVNAVKLISVNRGYDPRDFTMIAFGGGGAMHACILAQELGIKKVVIPRQSAVFSAWGMLMCDIRRDYLQTQIIELDHDSASEVIAKSLQDLVANALSDFRKEDIDTSTISFQRYGQFRYQNQAHSVEVLLPEGEFNRDAVTAVEEGFHSSYEREYTYRLDAPIELVGFHLVAIATVGKLEPEKLSPFTTTIADAIKERRAVDYAEGGIHDADIYHGELLGPAMKFIGPAIVEYSGTTVVIPPDFNVEVDAYGNLHILTAREELAS